MNEGDLLRGVAMEKKILIVDDEEKIRVMLETVFNKTGFITFTAETAQGGLDLMAENDIKIMFLDLKLPDISGLELCIKMKELDPCTIIYALTGYASNFDFSICREAGFDDYFTKPTDIGTLRKAAEEAFEKIERWEEN